MTRLMFHNNVFSISLLSTLSLLERQQLGQHFPSLLFCQAASLKGFKPQQLFQLKSSGVFQQRLGENCTTSGWQLTGAEAERNRRGRAGQQPAEDTKHSGERRIYLLALVESLAAVLLEILASFFLGWDWSRCSGPGCSGGAASLCSASELPPLVLGLSSGLGCTSLDMLTLRSAHSEEETQQICEHWKTDAENKTHNFLGRSPSTPKI